MSSSCIPPKLLFNERDSGTKKRSLDEAEKQPKLDQRLFVIRATTDDPFAAPRTFTPIIVISRARLPLAFLDPTRVGSRCFSSEIKSLQAAYEGGSEACVLIAQDHTEGRLYAVERIKTRTYALCRLASWLNLGNVESVLSAPELHDGRQRKRRAALSIGPDQPWWISAAVEQPMQSSEGLPSNAATPKLAMFASHLNNAQETQTQAQLESPVPPQDVPPLTDPHSALSTSSKVLPHDQLQELAKQYLQALYSSRAPLAFFIKGPLSRARAALIGDGVSLPRVTDLSAFLRDSILSSSIIDKKYRDILPNLVTELSLQGSITPEAIKSKRGKKWKAKRDKLGLFHNEKEYIKAWWDSHDDGAASAETQASMVRRRCASIRSRETYLQVILILEVLALEASTELQPHDLSADVCTQSQELEAQGEDSQRTMQGKRLKSKNVQDLAALLDTSIDKLCIWHSLQTSAPVKHETNDHASDDTNENDELVNFCRDNIVPFFMSRIPKIATMVNKKLGGLTAPASGKHKPAVSHKPGEPATRLQRERPPRRPLSRVATDTIDLAPKQVPMLHRSTTDIDAMPVIKREPSQDDSLTTIHSARKRQPAPRQRLNLARSISISGREVDFSAMSQANETKLRKKADLKERLRKEAKEAIDAIRKPNRQLAVKEYAEETDLSFAKATAKARPMQKHRGSNVSQIDATPARPKMLYPTSRRGRDQMAKSPHVLTSGQSIIPGSSTKMQARPHDLPMSSFAVPATGQRPRHGTGDVLDTPSRGFAKFMPSGLAHPPGMPDSPDAVRHMEIQQTPSKPIKQLVFSSGQKIGIQAAPPAVRVWEPKHIHQAQSAPSSSNVEFASDPRFQAETETDTTSIYAALGWNEDYEELS
nr:hypothetical protein CFP56_01057 [Quercus suber]